MKIKKEKRRNKIIIIFLIIIVLVVIAGIYIISKRKVDHTLKYDDFEKTAIYGYLEDSVLDIYTIYQLSGKAEFNETQVFQARIKKALDTYFLDKKDTSVPTTTILEMIESKYIPKSVDFHGIIVSGYKFNPNENTFVKSEDSYANMQNIETKINDMDYINKKVCIQNIEREHNNSYKVKFNILKNNEIKDGFVENSGEAVLTLNDKSIVIDSCSLEN